MGLGIAEEDILRMGTMNGASALGFGGRLGSMEPGKEAALVTAPCSARTIANPCRYILEEVDEEALSPLWTSGNGS